MRPPPQHHVVPSFKAGQNVPDLIHGVLTVSQKPGYAEIIEDHFLSADFLPPFLRNLLLQNLVLLPVQFPDPVCLWSAQDGNLFHRDKICQILYFFLILQNDIIHILISRKRQMAVRQRSVSAYIIRNIYQQICIFFQIGRIIIRMYGRYRIPAVIRIVNIDNVRLFLFQMIRPVMHDRHVLREHIPFVTFPDDTALGIFLIIWNRHHKSLAFRVRVRRFPHAFHAIPHGRLVGQEHDLQAILWQMLLHFIFRLPQNIPQLFLII